MPNPRKTRRSPAKKTSKKKEAPKVPEGALGSGYLEGAAEAKRKRKKLLESL